MSPGRGRGSGLIQVVRPKHHGMDGGGLKLCGQLSDTQKEGGVSQTALLSLEPWGSSGQQAQGQLWKEHHSPLTTQSKGTLPDGNKTNGKGPSRILVAVVPAKAVELPADR